MNAFCERARRAASTSFASGTPKIFSKFDELHLRLLRFFSPRIIIFLSAPAPRSIYPGSAESSSRALSSPLSSLFFAHAARVSVPRSPETPMKPDLIAISNR